VPRIRSSALTVPISARPLLVIQTELFMATQDLAGVHVLLVEDTDDSREALRVLLEFCGAQVTAAASASEAKRVLETIRPHVLVSDISMPDDGLEVVREVKAAALARGVHIPAIAITAYRGRREELLVEGFVDLVEKPFDPLTLCQVVRQHAQRET
jgi:CheY-like chemotaxis protein